MKKKNIFKVNNIELSDKIIYADKSKDLKEELSKYYKINDSFVVMRAMNYSWSPGQLHVEYKNGYYFIAKLDDIIHFTDSEIVYIHSRGK